MAAAHNEPLFTHYQHKISRYMFASTAAFTPHRTGPISGVRG
jgi:hypothetical protein